MTKWLLLTAGLGSADFENSARRVAAQAQPFGLFDKVVALSTKDVIETCKRITQRYPEQFRVEVRGFGHMVWKSELVLSALEGAFGDYEKVLWVDGGCELNPNLFTKFQLKRILSKAEKQGIWAFSLRTPEWQYTKKDLLARFGFEKSFEAESDQFQTTWMALSGAKGIEIAKTWLDVTLENYSFSDVEPSIAPERVGFIENRYDQSIFSLVCKSMNISPEKFIPAAGKSGWKSELRALFHPIWTARNRTGDTIIPSWIQRIQLK